MLLLRMVLALCLTPSFGPKYSFLTQGFSFLSLWKQKFTLNMAITSFDDQYEDCVKSMEDKVGGLQRIEFANPIYDETWKNATDEWNKKKAWASVPAGFKDEYAIAVLAYTQNKSNFYRVFNEAVRKRGQSKEYYLNKFPFKSFHFLLTRALQVLGSHSNEGSYSTFRGVKGIRFDPESKEIRFGSFASSSRNKRVATEFGDDTFFSIKTKYGVYIKEYSFVPDQEEVLIPPYEVFKVEEFTKTSSGKTHISLISSGKSSNYNCEYVKGAGLSRMQADVRMPFVFWGVLLMAGALGAPGFF